MIKQLKLTKAVIIVILGILALIAAKVMEANDIDGEGTVLAISGGLLMVGALLFLYPILFAKKVVNDAQKVELQPVAKTEVEHEEIAETEASQR